MKSVEMPQTAANGRENVANGDVVSRLASAYAWDDPAFKSNPTQKGFFRLSVNIAHDLGISGALNANIIEALTQLGAVRSLTPKGKPLGRTQSNQDNPTETTARGHGFFVPPRVQHSEAGDAGGDVSELAFVDLGEDGQPLEHEVGEFVGSDATVMINCNFGAAVETAEAATSAPETPKAVEYPEFGPVGLSRVAGSGVNLADVPKPSYLVGYSSALAEASAKVRSLGAPETLAAAASYAAMGWRVFPLAENAKVPEKDSHGFRDVSTDTGQLIQWFDDGEFFQKGGNPRRNLGIATGETDAGYDLVVLDVDVKGGKDGGKVLGGLTGELGSLPATPMASTPSGGLHYLFKAPKGSGIGCGVNVFKQHGDGLDIRGHGGYIVASPSEVDGKPYRWLNDLLPAWLPGSWVTALQAECPVGGKRGAVSSSSNGDGERVTRGELLTDQQRGDVHEVIRQFMATVIAKGMTRGDWLAVMAAAKNSGFDPEELRPWSELNADKDGFDSTWNSNLEAHPSTILKTDFLALFGIVNPATRRKLEQEAKEQAVIDAARDAAGIPPMPDWMRDRLPQRTNVSMPIAAVSDDRARVVLNGFIAKGNEVAERVQAGANVGHDAEYLFIAGMLTMNAEAVKYQVEHNPIPQNRSSKYQTNKGKVRAVIMHSDGSKPATAGDVKMDLFVPDYVGGTADAVTRLACRLVLDRDVAQGEKPTDDECALVHRVLELSPLGQYWRENATDISRVRNGWNLKSAVDNGLSRATQYSTNTLAALSGSGSGVVVGAQIPDSADWEQVFAAIVGLVHNGQIGWADGCAAVMRVINAKFAKVMMGGKALVVRDVYSPITKCDIYEFTALRELAEHHAHLRLQTGETDKGKAIIKDVFTAWKTWHECRSYSSVQFDPEGRQPSNCFNLWRGFAVEPKEGKHLLDKVMHHLEHVICAGNKTVFDYHMDWLALGFQRPWEPAGSSLVWRGLKGTGKGKMASFIQNIWGSHGIQIVDPEHLTGKFNGHMTGICFMFADEAFFAADPKATGILQARITESKMMVERKGIDPIPERNMLHVIMATNSAFAVPASADERRFCVTDVANTHKGDKAYFRALSADMDNPEVQAAFLYEMLHRDIGEFFASHIPETKALKDQRVHNLKSPAMWWLDCLHEGRILQFGGALSAGVVRAWPATGEATTDELFDSYTGWCDQRKINSYHRVTRRSFSQYLYGMFPRQQVGVRREKGVQLGTLDDAVSRFEQLEKVTVSG